MVDTRTDRHRQDMVVCIVQYTECSVNCFVGSVYYAVCSVQCATCRLRAVSICHCEVCRVCYVHGNHDIGPFLGYTIINFYMSYIATFQTINKKYVNN